MKRKLLGAGVISAMAIASVFTVNMNESEEQMSDLLLINVDELAQGEAAFVTCKGDGSLFCPLNRISNYNEILYQYN